VQCASCELWYHFVCIGVNPSELGEEDFLCQTCQSQNNLSDTHADDDQTYPTDILVINPEPDTEPHSIMAASQWLNPKPHSLRVDPV